MSKFKFNHLTQGLDLVVDVDAIQSDVDAKIAALVDSAPGTLDTLNELADALGDDPNFATTVSTQIGSKADQADLTNEVNDRLSGDSALQGQIDSLDVDVQTNNTKISADGTINDHSDVDTDTIAPVSGDFLAFDGNNWVPAVASPSIVQDLAVQGTLSLGDWFEFSNTGAGFIGTQDRTLLRWSGTADFEVRGIQGEQSDGVIATILSDSDSTLTFLHESTLATNLFRIDTLTEDDVSLNKGDSVTLVYNTTVNRYMIVEISRASDVVTPVTQISGTGGTTTVESANMVGGSTGMVASVGSFQIQDAAGEGLMQILANQWRISENISQFRWTTPLNVITSSATFTSFKNRVVMTSTGQTVNLVGNSFQGYTGFIYKAAGESFTVIGTLGASIPGHPNGIELVNDGDCLFVTQTQQGEYTITTNFQVPKSYFLTQADSSASIYTSGATTPIEWGGLGPNNGTPSGVTLDLNKTDFTVEKAGRYSVEGQFAFGFSSVWGTNTKIYVSLYVNNVLVRFGYPKYESQDATTFKQFGCPFNFNVVLLANDVVSIRVFHDFGETKSADPGITQLIIEEK